MAKLTKEKALQELDRLVARMDGLRGGNHTSSDHVRWQMGVVRFLDEIFGQKSSYYVRFRSLIWQYQGTMLLTGYQVLDPLSAEARYDGVAYGQALDTARGILLAARDELEKSELTEVYHGKDTPPEASTIFTILNLVDHKLRKLFREKPLQEKAVQDTVENMFIAADIEYSRESDSIEYSSKTYTPDFTVKKADLALEVKLCAKEGREKSIIGEVNDDIKAYSTKYGNILFVVYDCGFIRDVDRFSNHFGQSSGVIVRVIKH